ncbi:GntR family transcriptional regulator [Kitasatospora sp. NPDC059795]|uniref:GntR family transcriptional regulator n=1 Tax=Kitasatospora sp. NPDC059795 TaxID=3346949 RepID=UPI00365ECF78
MEHTPDPAYQRLANDLRAALADGTYPPGSTLPRITDLADRYSISKQTAREAIAVLESEGLVEVVRRRGTVVREQPGRRVITRSRQVHRDEIGYYFDPAAQPWVAVRKPTVGWGPAPREIAALLGVAPGGTVLIRDRLMGHPGTLAPQQAATSYLPEAIARGTRLAEGDTGPGGIYDRLERDLGHGPLTWHETIGARMPTPTETADLQLPRGTPVLRVLRTATAPDGTVVEVNDTRMSASAYEIGYPLTRDATAAWRPGGRRE